MQAQLACDFCLLTQLQITHKLSLHILKASDRQQELQEMLCAIFLYLSCTSATILILNKLHTLGFKISEKNDNQSINIRLLRHDKMQANTTQRYLA